MKLVVTRYNGKFSVITRIGNFRLEIRSYNLNLDLNGSADRDVRGAGRMRENCILDAKVACTE